MLLRKKASQERVRIQGEYGISGKRCTALRMWVALLCLLFGAALPVATADRVALVVGIDNYANGGGLPDLSNAVADAGLVAGELDKAGFKVILLRNENASNIRQALGELPHAKDVLFYFAGHGIQNEERNYLLGTDVRADLGSAEISGGIPLGEVVDALGRQQPENLVVFLDCCRNLSQGVGGGSSALRAGLVSDQYPGAVLCYAASPGSVALDGEAGKNGPFAGALARYIASNAELTQLLKNVTNEVMVKSGNRQVPYVAGSLGGDFFFRASNENSVASYREKLDGLELDSLESVATAVQSLQELCKVADEPTRSLLIGDFFNFREVVFETFNRENYKMLSHLAPGVYHADNSKYKQLTTRYDHLFNQIGAWVRHDGEGGGILAGRPMWMEGHLAQFITRDWLEFLAMQNRGTESPVALDAMLVISYGELAERVIELEDFLVRNYTFSKRDEVEQDLEWHLKIFLYGIDNSPIAPFDKLEVRRDYLLAIDRYLNKAEPVWQGVGEAQEFRNMLKTTGNRVTPEIRTFAGKMFMERPVYKRLERKEAKKVKSRGALGSSNAGVTVPAETPKELPGERFPETRLRVLTSVDLSRFDQSSIQYAINELFARHGASFPEGELRRNFERFSWYRPRPGVDFDAIERDFSTIEKANLQVLAEHRARHRDRVR